MIEGDAAAAGTQQQHHEDDADAVPLLSPPSSQQPHRASLGLETPRAATDEEEEGLATARLCLYASHFLSAWGARAWEFAAGLALFFPAGGAAAAAAAAAADSGKKSGSDTEDASLSLVAALGLAQQAAQALSGPFLGREVDRLPRLTAAERAYGLQAAGTLASAAAVLGARRVSTFPPSSSSPVLVYLLGSLAALFAALAAVGASAANLSVEREWTQALAKERRKAMGRSRSSSGGENGSGENTADAENEGNDANSSASSSAMLASLNAIMRRIDLACLLASPGVAGLLLSRAGTEAAVAVIALYSCCAWLPQAWLLRRAVRAAPSRLMEKEEVGTRRIIRTETATATAATAAAAAAAAAAAEVDQGGGEPAPPSSSFSPLAAYLSADAFPSAFALSLLYFTVLSFGPLATVYLNWRGLSEVELAFWRGVGAAAGIAATAVFPWVRSRLGQDAAGALGIGSQFLCLLAGCLAAFLPPHFHSFNKSGSESSSESSIGVPAAAATAADGTAVGGARLLAAALALSRFGLWLFDLFASQNLQERVPRRQLGAVNGVQSTLQASLGAASFAAGLLVHRPGSFYVLALGSLGSVSLALIVSVVGSVRLRRRDRERAERVEREREARREIAAAA